MNQKELIFQTEDIHKATEFISSKLDKPVIIENKNFELIAYSSSFEEFDQTQQKTILSKKCPVFIIDRLKKEGIVQKVESKPEPIRIEPIEELGFYQRIVIAAKHLGHTMGYIWVQESTSLLKEEDLVFLEEITSHIGKLIYDAYSRVNVKEGRKDELLWKLIHHEYGSETQFRHDSKQVQLRLPERCTVLIFSITDPQHNHLLGKLKDLIIHSPLRQDIQFLKTEFQIVMFVHGRVSDPLSATDTGRAFIEEVKQSLDGDSFYYFMIGLGKEYTKLIDIRKSFLEALEVIETANFIEPRPETMPREFAKLGVYRYLATLYEKNSSEDYFSEDLLILMKKDTEGQTNLLQTLEVYLANNGKAKQTAAELFIHPNTLNYRLKQILELTNIDLQDFNMKSYLYTELLLLNNVPGYYKRYQEAISVHLKE